MKTKTITTKDGTFEIFEKDRIISRFLKVYGGNQTSNLSMFLDAVSPGDVVLDVGAHVGTSVLPTARKIGDAGKVIAIEGHPATFKLLENNIHRNQVDNVVCLQQVVAKEATYYSFDATDEWQHSSGGMSFEEIDEQNVARNEAYLVKAEPIDNIVNKQVLDRVNAIKIDVEGMELLVLQSALETVDNFRPIIRIEISPKEDDLETTNAHLSGRGYGFFVNLFEARHDTSRFLPYLLDHIPNIGSVFDVFAIPRESPVFSRWTEYCSSGEDRTFRDVKYHHELKRDYSTDKALWALEQTWTKGLKNTAFATYYAHCLLVKGRTKKAYEVLSGCSVSGSGTDDLLMLARVQRMSGMLNEARETIDRLIGEGQRLPAIFMEQERILREQGLFRDGRRALKLALEVDPEDSDIYVQWAQSLLAEGNDGQAREKYLDAAVALRNIIEVRSDEPGLHLKMADIQLALKEVGAAVESVEAAMALEPENTELLAKKIAILIEADRLSEAEESLLDSRTKYTEAAHIYYLLSMVLYLQDRKAEAVEEIARAISLDSRNQTYLLHSCELNLMLGYTQRAQEDYNKAKEIGEIRVDIRERVEKHL